MPHQTGAHVNTVDQSTIDPNQSKVSHNNYFGSFPYDHEALQHHQINEQHSYTDLKEIQSTTQGHQYHGEQNIAYFPEQNALQQTRNASPHTLFNFNEQLQHNIQSLDMTSMS